jgi:hypothetical protein
MLHKFLADVKFHRLLVSIDRDISIKTQEKGCTSCGGKLHQADYPRSPFGVNTAFREHYRSRFSLCCMQCRRRATPSSVRFFGRCWYVAPLFLLINALMGQSSTCAAKDFQKQLGVVVNKRTWKRWRKFWLLFFPTTAFWKCMKGIVALHIDQDTLPGTLLDTYLGSLEEKLKALLVFFAPITAGAFACCLRGR